MERAGRAVWSGQHYPFLPSDFADGSELTESGCISETLESTGRNCEEEFVVVAAMQGELQRIQAESGERRRRKSCGRNTRDTVGMQTGAYSAGCA